MVLSRRSTWYLRLSDKVLVGRPPLFFCSIFLFFDETNGIFTSQWWEQVGFEILKTQTCFPASQINTIF